MTQTAIPFHFFRGGTSRGPYFLNSDLPEDEAVLSSVLIAAIGAGNPRNIDGLGGGSAVTTKVAILSRSEDPKADVDYLFAQVSVEERLVDYGPTCGNILVGVGPAAIEMGLVQATEGETRIRVRAVNTGALIEQVVQTPDRQVRYDGNVAIDGVPGTAAPVVLKFMDVVGSRTGAMFPTGNTTDEIGGVRVSCVDVAMPMMIARAQDFGIVGNESQEELDAMQDLFVRMEAIRLEAGRRMGLGDVARQVTPKVGLVSKPATDGNFRARYFLPWATHPTLAVTGAQCLAACALAPGTVMEGVADRVKTSPATIAIEHPMGSIEVTVEFSHDDSEFRFRSAGVVRTSRLIARGEVLVPASVWSGTRGKRPTDLPI